jgi:hypothetical protein
MPDVVDRLGSVHLRFQPFWRYIDGIREFCGFFTRTTFEDPALGQRVGLVIHELVENAIRYGDSTKNAELDVFLFSDEQTIEVSVGNSTTPEQIRALEAAFAQLAGRSPEEAFLEAMGRASSKPDGGGLGLPRVQFEGRVELSLALFSDRVRVHARGTV